MAETTDEDAVKPKPRPIIRIGLFLISHYFFVSVVCCTAGVLALLLLPVLAKNTYISENALMPGSASPMLSGDDVSDASRFVDKIMSLDSSSIRTGIEIPNLIAQHITDLGGEFNYHKFQPQLQKFHPRNFFSGPDRGIIQERNDCTSFGVNTVGIIRAPRGDGKEAIVFVTPYNASKITSGEALSLGIGYSVFSLLSRVTWLAKDIIWLASDSQHGEYAAVAAWLRDYHTPVFGNLKKHEICRDNALYLSKTSPNRGTDTCDGLRRAGTMAAALVIKVADNSVETEKDALSIYAEASNGQMPNLDLINIVNYLAVHGQGLRVKVEKVWSLLNSWWLKNLGGLVEFLAKVARSLNPQWKFGISVADYVEGSATLASSLYNQALGIPTGPHGAFRDYQVDSITIEFSRQFSLNNKFRPNEFLLKTGRLIESVVRSVNNLLEKFHQSFFLYLMTSPNKFVSVGVYMIAFVLLVAPLPLAAASLFSDASKCNSNPEKEKVASQFPADESAITVRSWNWLHAAKTVFIVHLWGATVSLFPYFLYQISGASPLTSLLIWVVLSALGLLILQLTLGSSSNIGRVTHPQRGEWALLKSVTVAAVFIGLCLMSVINFATAELGALLLVPLCLTVTPLRFSFKTKTSRGFVQGVFGVGLLILGFPPVAYFVLKGALEGYEYIGVDDFWSFVESLWAWNSATYIYTCMVHLPCWVLCLYTLLHPC